MSGWAEGAAGAAGIFLIAALVFAIIFFGLGIWLGIYTANHYGAGRALLWGTVFSVVCVITISSVFLLTLNADLSLALWMLIIYSPIVYLGIGISIGVRKLLH